MILRKKSRITRRAITIALLIVIVGAYAYGTRHVSRELGRLERILAILEKSHEYLWKVRGNLATEFEGAVVHTDKYGFRLAYPDMTDNSNQKNYKICTFGASPTFGYGVDASLTYAMVAQSILQKYDPGIKVKNVAQVGYSSWQGRRLFKKMIKELAPDMVTVSYMVNDIDRLRFYFSNGMDDENTSPPSKNNSKTYNFISSFPLTNWLNTRNRRLLVGMMKNRSKRRGFELAHVRVNKEDYRKNLAAFAADCRDLDIKLVFIKMPFKLPYPIPNRARNYYREMEKGASLIESEKYDEALAVIDNALEHDKYASEAKYYKGRIIEAKGDVPKANEFYREGIKSLIYDCVRDAGAYNKIMEETAKEWGAPLIDAASGLGDGAGADMNLFVKGDYIHPNEKGHKIIGGCLSRGILKILKGESGWFAQYCD